MDIDLFYEEKGSGTPLVLLHGNGEDHTYFAHQMEYFSIKYRVIAIDTRGHGQSPRGTMPFTIAQFAVDLYDFVTRHDLAQVHLLGFSDGANIALSFALEHPELVRTLILNGGNLDPKGVKGSVQLPIEVGYRIASLFAKRSPDARAHAELLGLMVNEPHVEPATLSQLPMPTLVIAGTKDMIKGSHTRLIATSIPGAKLVLLPGDHFVANKQADAFNRAVTEFLSANEG